MNSAVITRPWTSNQTSLRLLSLKGVFEANLLKHWCLIFVCPSWLLTHTHTHVPAPPRTVALPPLPSGLAESDTEKTSQMTNTKKRHQGCDSATYFNALKNVKKKKKNYLKNTLFCIRSLNNFTCKN